MSIQLNEENGGKVLAVHVSGKLVKADCECFVPEFERLSRQHGRLHVLFDMSGFHGWEAAAIWEDTKFAIYHYTDIEKIAMVGEKSWQHGMAKLLCPHNFLRHSCTSPSTYIHHPSTRSKRLVSCSLNARPLSL